jgi:hypothetical protein
LVWLFLGMFAVCGVFGFELWPLTGWRLFADARQRYNVSWSAEAEYGNGSSSGLALQSAALSGTPFLIGRLNEISMADRNRLCAEWLDVGDINRIDIYRSVSDLGARVDDRAAPPTRELAYTCENRVISAVRPAK